MTVQSLPFVPPAPAVHPKNLPVWRLLCNGTRSSLSIWPDYALDALYVRNSVMGLKTIVVSDPEGVRHVLAANAANYRRPPVARCQGRCAMSGPSVVAGQCRRGDQQPASSAPPPPFPCVDANREQAAHRIGPFVEAYKR